MSVPFLEGTYTGKWDELGPVHSIPKYDPPNNLTDNVVIKQVDAGGPSSPHTVYAPCGAAGSAMYDPDSLTRPGPAEISGFYTGKHCWLMYAPPIIIHSDIMSVKQGMMHVNMVHRTSNISIPITTNAALSTLGAIG